MQVSDVVTLLWADREARPLGSDWASEKAERWQSLSDAIRFATAMQRDKAAVGLFPWIWTPLGHVYSPSTIEAMGRTFEENRRLARGAAPPNAGRSENAERPVSHVRVHLGGSDPFDVQP